MIFLYKFIDSLISTGKTICVSRGHKIYASVLVGFSQLMFFFIINKIVESNTPKTAILISFAAMLGTYLSIYLSDRFSQDKEFSFLVANNDKEKMKELSNFLKIKKIKHVVNKSFDKDFNDTFSAIIFTKTKKESSLLEKEIEEGSFFKRELKV